MSRHRDINPAGEYLRLINAQKVEKEAIDDLSGLFNRLTALAEEAGDPELKFELKAIAVLGKNQLGHLRK